MKILQAIESSGPGGAERVLGTLCDRLRDRGHDVEVLLIRSGWLETVLEEMGVRVTVLPVRRSLDRDFLDALGRLLQERSIDLLHTHEMTLGVYGAMAARRLGIRHVATAHGLSFAGNWKRRLAVSWALRRRAKFRLVAVSDALAGELSGRVAIARRDIDVIFNGVPVSAAVARRAPASDAPIRLVAVGNLYPVKNHALLIRAVRELTDRGSDVRLQILGRGSEHETLQSLIRQLNLESKVSLEGFCEDVSEFLERADLFVSSSLSEGMPVSFLEAMSAGVPIVASRVGGVPEIVRHGEHGQLFESGDLRGLVSEIELLARDPQLRARLGTEASRRARGQFSADAMVGRYETLYRNLES